MATVIFLTSSALKYNASIPLPSAQRSATSWRPAVSRKISSRNFIQFETYSCRSICGLVGFSPCLVGGLAKSRNSTGERSTISAKTCSRHSQSSAENSLMESTASMMSLTELLSRVPEKKKNDTSTHWLAYERCGSNLTSVFFKFILLIDIWSISRETDLRWVLQNLIDGKSTLVQVIAWCLQAPSHYLSQCWPIIILSYGIYRPQWLDSKFHKLLPFWCRAMM